ncbi:hypothetical protein [Rhizobium lusitanum]|uniref:Uncharacterized protein n=1 Tax=Rhizobium lusitanum TaxID=293958 RepID=A0A7X0IW75_9HYPH|nr:hypothetical protein [Rhizobium lusitanum]MBB6488321.1 hypothetical protein [Rhizobium lusitanum]
MKKSIIALTAALATCTHIARTTPAFATDDACAPVRAMSEKLNATSRARLDGTSRLMAISFTSLFVDAKQWWREGSEPWHVEPRQYSKTSDLENCQHVGSETIDGVRTEIWSYDHLSPEQVDSIKIWISVETGLPLKSHFKRVEQKNGVEWDGIYTYSPDIKDPA